MLLSDGSLRQLEPRSEPVISREYTPLSSAPNSPDPMPLSEISLDQLDSQFPPVPFRESSPLDLASSADLEDDAPPLAVTLALRQAERAEEAANLSRRRVTEAYQRTEQPERVIPGHAVVGFSIDIEASNIHRPGRMPLLKANQRQLESQSESWESSPLPSLSSAESEHDPPPSPAQEKPVIIGHAVVISSIVTEASNIRQSNEYFIPASRDTSKEVQPRPGPIHVANPASRPGKGQHVVRATYRELTENTHADIAQTGLRGNPRKRPLSTDKDSEQDLRGRATAPGQVTAENKKIKTSGRSTSIVRRPNPRVRNNENGGFEFEIKPGKWIRAVYHSSKREVMYHNFCPWLREWEDLFPWQQGNEELWDLTSNDKDHYYLTENGQNFDEDPAMSEVPEMTWHNGTTIVLASDNQPILNFPSLPATISSKINGKEIQLLE
ncbi:MAG: hypothetical protein Q9226_008041 [Calogaya cf. arnoldii]